MLCHCTSKKQQRGPSWAHWGKLNCEGKLRGNQDIQHIWNKSFYNCESSKAPYKPTHFILALCHCTKAAERSLLWGLGGVCHQKGKLLFQANAHGHFTLRRESTLLRALTCLSPTVIITDQTQAASSQRGLGWVGQWPAWLSFEAVRLRSWLDWAVSLPSPHTWRDPQCQATTYNSQWQLLFNSSWGKDARLLWVDLLDLSPRAGKWSVRVLPSVLILRGHKIVRAITTHINKTCVSGEENENYEGTKRKNYYNLGLIRQFFQGLLLHLLVCVLSVREIPRHVLLYITVVSDLSLTLATVWEIWMWTKTLCQQPGKIVG